MSIVPTTPRPWRPTPRQTAIATGLPEPWTRGSCLALALPNCSTCIGLGTRQGRAGRLSICACVYRAVFRACFERFVVFSTQERFMSRVTLDAVSGRKNGAASWGRKNEEYIADFCLISKRALNEFEHRIFRYHYLLGADWKLCCRRLRMDRGNFFHAVYRVEKKLGAAYAETRPYSLYPIDEYLNGARLGAVSCQESPAGVPPPRKETAREYGAGHADAAAVGS